MTGCNRLKWRERARVIWLVAMSGLGLVAADAASTVQLSVGVRDDAGRPMAARVLVRDDAGHAWVPPVAAIERIGPDTWFACPGDARLDVAAGHYFIQVERGPEYMPVSADVTLQASASREFHLHRWIDLAARGYRSGENHLHVPPPLLPVLMEAENLDYGSSLQWWNGPKFRVAIDAPADPRLTLFDAEVENAWGAVYCVGLSRPLSVPWNPARANLAFIDAARDAGGFISYQGGWSAEALVDALLGRVDAVNIGDNLFQRHKFMPRARYSNVLGVAGLPAYPETAEGMLALATESYYRLLNCGLRLAAGAGSATGVKSNPAGYNRAYVRVPEGATAREFLEAWRAGRNFVTNGPMVFLTANGSEPGDTIALPASGGKLHVRVEALARFPLRSVRIVVNGRAVASSPGGGLEADVDLKEGAWIAAVATAEEPMSDADRGRYRQTSRLGGEEPTGLHFGHTSPIYVTVGGAGARVEGSVREASRLLDAFAGFAQKTAAPEFRSEIADAIAAARTRLESPAAAVAASGARNTAIIPKPKDGAWLKRHEGFVAEAKRGGIEVLFLGDSITDFWRATNPRRGGRAVWDREFAPLPAANFGIAGDRTQNVLWRIQHGELDGLAPKVVVLMIGTNNIGFEHDKKTLRNTPAEAAAGVTAVVRELRRRLPRTKILLLGVFPKGDKPGGAGRANVAAVNRLIAGLDDGRQVRFLDIGASFLAPDGTLSADIMADFGHPTLKGYELWAAAMKPLLRHLLDNSLF
jgi:lysophospholipase L1-like esterase